MLDPGGRKQPRLALGRADENWANERVCLHISPADAGGRKRPHPTPRPVSRPTGLAPDVRRAFHCWARAVGSGTQGAAYTGWGRAAPAPTQRPRSTCPVVKPAQAPEATTGQGRGNGGFLQEAKLSPEPHPIPDPPRPPPPPPPAGTRTWASTPVSHQVPRPRLRPRSPPCSPWVQLGSNSFVGVGQGR